MKTFKQHLNEKTEYYLDTSQDNNEKYVAYDGDYGIQVRQVLGVEIDI